MRILVVGKDFPWPTTNGSRMRMANVVTALASLGEVDLFTYCHRYRSAPTVAPDSVELARMETVLFPREPRRLRWRTEWLAHRGVPRDVVKGRLAVEPRQRFEQWAHDHYDLVWFNAPDLFGWMGRPRLGPTVVNFDDLEDARARLRMQMAAKSPAGGTVARARRAVSTAQERMNADDWRRFSRSLAEEVDRVVLCSDLEAEHAGFDNVTVIPNSYDRPAHPAGSADVGVPPTLLMQGTLDYGPNVDGARWLVHEVAPLLWEQVPDAQIRLVGTPTAEVKRLHRPPAVTVVGRVRSMAPELARADACLVPIRWGGGTRIKIAEALAHRVPVVSTTIGAEGLRIVGGEHLLLADDAAGFAASCAAVLTDRGLRARLIEEGERRYAQEYEGEIVRGRIRDLALEVAAAPVG